MANKGRNNAANVTWAEAARDVLVTSMNKGQLPLVIVGAIVFLVLYRMPPERVAMLVDETITNLKTGCFVGYALFLLTSGAWYVQARSTRRAFADEVRRVGAERDRWQEQALGKNLKSSDKK